MSMLNDLKKLLFGAKAAAKSAGEKAVEAGKEAGEELGEKSKEYFDKAKARAQELKDEYGPKAKEAFDDARGFAEGLVDEAWKKTESLAGKAQQKAKSFFDDEAETEFLKSKGPQDTASQGMAHAEPFLDDSDEPRIPKPEGKTGKTGEKLKGMAEEAGKKVAGFSEKVGKEVLDQGEKAWEKFQDASEQVGKKIMDVSEDVGGKITGKFNELVEKANEEAARESLDDTTDKAREASEALERRVQERSAKSNVENLKEDAGKGPLGGFDSFFDRAQRFAEGDYHNEGGKDVKIQQDPEYKPAGKTGSVKGFEDLDGDGDEIVDDAILDLDDENNDDVLGLEEGDGDEEK
ncbi:MAG: hypothetical protein H6564_20440 [Lewinellaceae bacterium]|nr:hypothetical protein [Lewinellaceae bacterium]